MLNQRCLYVSELDTKATNVDLIICSAEQLDVSVDADASEITGLAEGREVTLTSRQGPVTASYTYRCQPDGDGTRLGLVADCQIRGPLRVVGPVLRQLIKRTDAGQIRALKRLLEES